MNSSFLSSHSLLHIKYSSVSGISKCMYCHLQRCLMILMITTVIMKTYLQPHTSSHSTSPSYGCSLQNPCYFCTMWPSVTYHDTFLRFIKHISNKYLHFYSGESQHTEHRNDRIIPRSFSSADRWHQSLPAAPCAEGRELQALPRPVRHFRHRGQPALTTWCHLVQSQKSAVCGIVGGQRESRHLRSGFSGLRVAKLSAGVSLFGPPGQPSSAKHVHHPEAGVLHLSKAGRLRCVDGWGHEHDHFRKLHGQPGGAAHGRLRGRRCCRVDYQGNWRGTMFKKTRMLLAKNSSSFYRHCSLLHNKYPKDDWGACTKRLKGKIYPKVEQHVVRSFNEAGCDKTSDGVQTLKRRPYHSDKVVDDVT